MFLPQDGIASVGGGSIFGRAHGDLLARASTPSLVAERESEHKKIDRRYWKSQKSRKITMDRTP